MAQMFSDIHVEARPTVGFDVSERETMVVDLGCCPHNGDISVGRLVERYNPVVLFGFDPLLSADEIYQMGDTTVHLEKKAAWTHEGKGTMGVGSETEWSLLNATMLRDKTRENEWSKEIEVEFFDFGTWLLDVVDDYRSIVKMNIEGAEFPLLEDLHERDLDSLIDLLHVSWHDDRMGGDYPARREHLESVLRCPVEPWELW